MTRRLLASLTLTGAVTAGLVVAAAPASAYQVCVGAESQRNPGTYPLYFCLDPGAEITRG